MKIQDISTVIRGFEPRIDTETTPTETRRTPVREEKSIHGDIVNLSAPAKLALVDVAAFLNSEPTTLPPERLVQIREQIKSGRYDSLESLTRSARAISDFYSH